MAAVTKSYRKACIKVHPDKNVGNSEQEIKATEIFKHLNEAMADYKKMMEGATIFGF